MQVCDLVLRNALQVQHGCCRGSVSGVSFGTKLCVFSGIVAPAGDERYLVCVCSRNVAVASELLCLHMCVRSYRVMWNLGLQIARDWLHDCCLVVLPCASRDASLRRGVAKHIVVAASRCLGITAAYVILFSFPAEHRKS